MLTRTSRTVLLVAWGALSASGAGSSASAAEPTAEEPVSSRFQEIDKGMAALSLRMADLEKFLDKTIPLIERTAKHAANAPTAPSWTSEQEKSFIKACLSSSAAAADLLAWELEAASKPKQLIPKSIHEDWLGYFQCLAFSRRSPQPCDSLTAADVLIARKKPPSKNASADDTITLKSWCRERYGILRFLQARAARAPEALKLCLEIETEEYLPETRPQACALLAGGKDARTVCEGLLPIMRKDDPEITLNECLFFVGKARGDLQACASATDATNRLECEAAAAYAEALTAKNPELCRGNVMCRSLMAASANSCEPLLGRVKSEYCGGQAMRKREEAVKASEEFKKRKETLPADLQRDIKALIHSQRESVIGPDEFSLLEELHKHVTGEEVSGPMAAILVNMTRVKIKVFQPHIDWLSSRIESHEPKSDSGRQARLLKIKALGKRLETASKRVKAFK